MSFGDGNLREKCDQYRRQLGGMTAAHNRAKQRAGELESLVRDMYLTWKRLDLEGDWPTSGHNGWKTFEQRMSALGIEVER